jgi:type II secretory pathway component PulJ
MKIFLYLTKKVKGYSLVEILVVLGLFSSISTLSLGALLNAQSVNVKLQETQAILDNMNLSIQTITRDIRFGSNFNATTTSSNNASQIVISTKRRNCVNGCTVLIMKPADAVNSLDRVAYYLSNGVLYKGTYPNSGPTETLQMTSDDVNISSLTFYVDGAQTFDSSNDDNDAFDYKQPLITILLSGSTRTTKSNATPSTFNIETAVSARELDN